MELTQGRKCWVIVDFLGLDSPFKEEWLNYISGLQNEGIILSPEADCLTWTWNIDIGIPTTNLIYKIRENLKKKGWYGPVFCSLCRLEDEDTYHHFQGCSFAKAVWFYVLQNLKLNEYVEEQILEGVLQNWLHNK